MTDDVKATAYTQISQSIATHFSGWLLMKLFPFFKLKNNFKTG